MFIGYIRVSTLEQNTDLQFDAFKKFGCEKIFFEKISGTNKDRPEFNKMLSILRKGDTVLVWEISRLGRNMVEMINIVDGWANKGIGIKSISEPFIDTTSEAGDFILKLFILLAETERKRLIRRINEGLSSARARGRVGGRKAGLTVDAIRKAKRAVELYNSKELTTAEICLSLKISRATLYSYLRSEGLIINGWTQIKKKDSL